MSNKTEQDKKSPQWPWTARQYRSQFGKRLARKQDRKAKRNT